ncbi:MAG: type II secretion system protein E, partial [Paracoccaceae bacterium]
MSLSYLQSSIDRLEDAKREDVIEICINPDGSCWGEFQGDHFMSRLAQTLTGDQVKDLGNQIASDAGTPLSKDKPIVSVSITYRDRPIRAQVITPPAVSRGMSISLRFFSSLSLDSIKLGFLYGRERKLEELRQNKNRQLREVVASGEIDA